MRQFCLPTVKAWEGLGYWEGAAKTTEDSWPKVVDFLANEMVTKPLPPSGLTVLRGARHGSSGPRHASTMYPGYRHATSGGDISGLGVLQMEIPLTTKRGYNLLVFDMD